MKRLVFSVILGLALNGCAARMSKAMATWMNQPATRLLAQWGPPSQIIKDGDSEVYVYLYEESEQVTRTSQAPVTVLGSRTSPNAVIIGGGSTSRTSVETERKWRMFWVNDAGIIHHWSWRGY